MTTAQACARGNNIGVRLIVMMGCAAVGAWAQTPSATCSTNTTMCVSYTGYAYGKPGDVEFTTASFANATNSTGSITLNGKTLTFISMEMIGTSAISVSNPQGTPLMTSLNIVIADNLSGAVGSDSIVFVDNSPTATYVPGTQIVIGRTGVLKFYVGTGPYEGLNVSLPYSFTCLTHCPSIPTTVPVGSFQASFSADSSGSLPAPPPAVVAPRPVFQTLLLQKISGGLGGPTVETYEITTSGGSTDVGTPATSSSTGTDNNNVVLRDSVKADTTSSGGADGSVIFPTYLQFVPTTYSATATCANLPTGCWITIPDPTGAVPAVTSGSVTANLDWTSLPTGVYPSNVSITTTPTNGSYPPVTQNSPVNLILTNGAPFLQLSETGIPFQAVAGAPPAQQVHPILLASSGAAIPYQVTASTLTGGSWLSVLPASGTVPASGTATVNLAVNAAGLAAGSYFGKVDINAPSAATALQSVEVELTVAASAPAAPILSTTGLIFVTQQNGSAAAQTVTLSTLSSQAISVTGATVDANGGAWLNVIAPSTNLVSGAPITQTVSVGTTGLTPGVYTGTLEESTSTANYPVAVVLIVTTAAGTCTPTQFLPVLTNLYNGFELPAALPVSLQAEIVDDCGTPLTSGAVEVSFPSNDPAVTMTALGDGQWSGTWEPHGAPAGVTSVAVSAQSAAGLAGSTSINGTIDANTTLPVVTPGGIGSAAASALGAILAPGGFISIYGSNLAPSNLTAAGSQSLSYPLLTTLAGTQVLLGGQALPLQVVSSQQINAIVPFETPVNGFQELLVEQNGVYGLPETVVMAAVAPAVFTESANPGAGAIVVVQADGTAFVATPSQSASAGDVLEVYCTGLGAVNPPVADGAAASLTTVSNAVNPVTATVGGQSAKVLFAGLAPGYAGLYQVDVVVPTGVTAGATVPLILTQMGLPTAPVTVAIQ